MDCAGFALENAAYCEAAVADTLELIHLAEHIADLSLCVIRKMGLTDF